MFVSEVITLTEIRPTKERILEAAIDLFSQNGFSAVSIRDITRAVGIKESSLYNHFASKDLILEQILGAFRGEYRTMLPPLAALDQILAATRPEDFLLRGFLNLKERLADPTVQKLWRIIQMEQYRHPLAREIVLQDMVQDTLRFLEVVFAKLIAAGKVRPLPPRQLATTYQYPIFAMTTEWTLLRFADQDTTDIEQRMVEHINLFLDLVRIS